MSVDRTIDKMLTLSKKLRKALLDRDTDQIIYLSHVQDSLSIQFQRFMIEEPVLADTTADKLRTFQQFNRGNGLLASRQAEAAKSRIQALNPVYGATGKLR